MEGQPGLPGDKGKDGVPGFPGNDGTKVSRSGIAAILGPYVHLGYAPMGIQCNVMLCRTLIAL